MKLNNKLYELYRVNRMQVDLLFYKELDEILRTTKRTYESINDTVILHDFYHHIDKCECFLIKNGKTHSLGIIDASILYQLKDGNFRYYNDPKNIDYMAHYNKELERIIGEINMGFSPSMKKLDY